MLFGRDVAFIANAASFVAAALFVSLIRRPMQAPRAADPGRPTRMRPIADMHEAFSYARRDHAILALMASKATFAMGAGIVGLLAVLADRRAARRATARPVCCWARADWASRWGR